MGKKLALEIGVVGWNGRGGGVAGEAYEATGGLMKPVACVEPYDNMYAEGCARFKFTPRRYRTVSEMLSGERLDGALIASPNAFHLENLQAFKGSGIPLMLEKPLDSTFEKICEVVRFCRGYNAPVAVGHCMRYAPILRQAHAMLRRGDIGQLCSARFVQNCHYGNTGYHGWRRDKKSSGTWLIEKATHDFDIMLWLLGAQPQTVAALSRLQAYGGSKPPDLRCQACPERAACPESIQNIRFRWGINYEIEELKNADDLCVFSSAADTPDNDHCLFAFANGLIGTYVQWFFSPRSYHHRVYEIHGTAGALEIDLGAEFGGRILFCPRYGTHADQLEYKFDYLLRSHYNGDGEMTRHLYRVFRGEEQPQTTVEQAFLAELMGYAAIRSAGENRFICPPELVPPDLADICQKKIY